MGCKWVAQIKWIANRAEELNLRRLQKQNWSDPRAADDDGGAGVGSLCNSSLVDPAGVTANHAATLQASGDPCSGFTLGETTITFDPAAGLPTSVLVQLRGNNSVDPFPLVGFDAAGNALGATRVSTTSYTSQNGFFVVRQDVMEIQSSVGIAGISMNLAAGSVAVFMDDLIINR